MGATGLTTSDALSGVGGTDSPIDSEGELSEAADAPDSDETSGIDSLLGCDSGAAAGLASALA